MKQKNTGGSTHGIKFGWRCARRSLQNLTLFKTKMAHFAPLFKARDLILWLWIVSFCIQNDQITVKTPPYGHLGNTVTSLLRPLFFGRLAKAAIHFLIKKPSLIRPNVFGPLVTVLTGFNYNIMELNFLFEKIVGTISVDRSQPSYSFKGFRSKKHTLLKTPNSETVYPV